jgi:metalloendopeptidase OMA1, mitochondrial
MMRLHGFFVMCLILCVASCATVPHSGRRQFNIVSDKQLNEIAVQAFKDVVSKEPASKNEQFKAIVQRVAERVCKAADEVDRTGFKWEVKVLDKPEPNAFCLPGGKIVVNEGIASLAKNEAGLAAIIGHETAHATARHGAERLSQKLLLDGALSVGKEVIRKEDGTIDQRGRLILGALGLGGTVGVILPYSRVHEFEADRIGQLYMAKAGYDPEESVRLWDRLGKIKKPPIPVWLSTHPTDDERVAKLRETLPDAKRLLEQAPAKYGLGSVL